MSGISITQELVYASTLSSINVYTNLVSTASVYADFLVGDGSQLTNLTLPTSYAAYSIPWNAMQSNGSINIYSGTWTINGPINTSTVNVDADINTSTIVTNTALISSASIASQLSRYICTFYLSANTVTTETNYFGLQGGDKQYVNSSFMNYLSTGVIAANVLDIANMTAQQGFFSSLSTGSLNIINIELNSINLLDQKTRLFDSITASNAELYMNGIPLLKDYVSVAQLNAVNQATLYQLYLTSNAIDIRPAFSTLYKVTQSSVSSLSTTIGLSSNVSKASLSNYSVIVDSDLRGLNTSFTTLQNRVAADEATSAVNFSTLRINISTSISNLSVSTYALNSNTSTSTGYSISTLYGTVSSIFTSLSSLSTSMGSNASTLSSSILTLSTNVNSNLSTIAPTISTTVGSSIQAGLVNISTIIGSNLSTSATTVLSSVTLALSSLAAETTSTLSTQASYQFSSILSVSQLGLSSLSTAISQTTFLIPSTFSTHTLLVNFISSGNISTGSLTSLSLYTSSLVTSSIYTGTLYSGILSSVNLYTSSVNTRTISSSTSFITQMQGSTMSSLTQYSGKMVTNTMTASSFSGNLNDAYTLIIQSI